MKYIYVVWFQDRSLNEHDQDYEWPACMIINAEDKNSAITWGNILSQNYIKENNLLIVKSSIEDYIKNEGNDELPSIELGKFYSNDYIGW